MFVALWFILRIQNLIDFLMKTNPTFATGAEKPLFLASAAM